MELPGEKARAHSLLLFRHSCPHICTKVDTRKICGIFLLAHLSSACQYSMLPKINQGSLEITALLAFLKALMDHDEEFF